MVLSHVNHPASFSLILFKIILTYLFPFSFELGNTNIAWHGYSNMKFDFIHNSYYRAFH